MKNYGGDTTLLHFKASNIYLHVKNKKHCISTTIIRLPISACTGTLVDIVPILADERPENLVRFSNQVLDFI